MEEEKVNFLKLAFSPFDDNEETRYIKQYAKQLGQLDDFKHLKLFFVQYNDIKTYKQKMKLEKLPECSNFKITSGGYEGIWTTLFVKPIAFLISEQQVVYCLYEGKNTFGSAKINSNCDQHQKIILPGLSVRPVHFSILITTIENRKRCIINEVGGDVSTLCVNSTTNAVVNDTQLSDGDEITVSINQKDSKIKFRININK